MREQYCNKCDRTLPIHDFWHRNIKNKVRHVICKWCQGKDRLGKQKYVPRDYVYIKPKLQRVASQRIRDAIRFGKIRKPNICSDCNWKFPKHKLCGHHFNGYENIFDIIWLCHLCHAKAHRIT